jgi:DNA-binding transcriptional LysR family regulator
MKNPKISLDQWLAFKTVIDTGSYAAAAEALNKSQSSVSYAIGRLNDQLPEPVLSLQGRKAEVTEAGNVLYRHAESLINQAAQTESVARSLAQGFESEVTLALDVLIEVSSLICAFESFSKAFPFTRIRVLETSLSGTTEALLEKQADLVITASVPTGFLGTPLLPVHMIPVAVPSHALVQEQGPVSEMQLRAHRQVVMRDTGSRREQDVGWLGAEQRWTVSHFASSIKLLKSGLVFAFIPQNWVQQELDRGELVQIQLEAGLVRQVQTYLLFADRDVAGPATRELAQLIIDQLAPKKS